MRGEGEIEFEVTPEYLIGLRNNCVEPNNLLQDDTYESDRFKDDPAAPQWIKDWSGPFYLEVIGKDK